MTLDACVIFLFLFHFHTDAVTSPRYWSSTSTCKETLRYSKRRHRKAAAFPAKSRRPITFYKRIIFRVQKEINGIEPPRDLRLLFPPSSDCFVLILLHEQIASIMKSTEWLAIFFYGVIIFRDWIGRFDDNRMNSPIESRRRM